MGYAPIHNAKDFERRIVIGEAAESKYLEFKAEYAWHRDDRREQGVECARDVAQFANTEGGTILVGIDEGVGASGLKVASAVRGVDDPSGLIGWIEQKIRTSLVPATVSRHCVNFEVNGKALVAINVPPSVHLVAVWDTERKRGVEYLYRTDHGKEWMNPDEVERHLMNGSRAAKLAVMAIWEKLDDAARGRPIVLVPPIAVQQEHFDPLWPTMLRRWIEHEPEGESRPNLKHLGDNELEILMYGERSLGHLVRVPYAYVQAVWVTSDSRLALGLSVRIVRAKAEYHLEPV
ncbi:MAG: ATP-binding protein [Polyangiaceae bacterium]